eukprot:TRINITY_DN765_c3_g1_i2.p2 TRINITY_DN765_c3_g1~~TRINITY_DN765_c3_g1_i2.p2  ORF type:complete len:150 (+),score=44.30 TRINITY_DN765_c3_g1_i2:65-451(+)
MASIKVLNIVLVLMCIVVTAFICTFLAITSSDTALDDTKQSRDTSVNAAFAVGEESVQNRTQEYLTTVVDGSVDYMVQFLKQQRLAGEAIADDVKQIVGVVFFLYVPCRHLQRPASLCRVSRSSGKHL